MSAAIKLLAAVNLLGLVVSLALLAATFSAEGFIVRKARQFALDKTRNFLEPAIPKAEKLLANPLVAKTLPMSVKEKITGELEAYHASPEQWLLEIAEGSRAGARSFEFPEIKNPLARKAVDFVTERIAGAPAHFERSFANLILDLRIFAGTHAVVFLVAAGLCVFAKTPRLRFWLSVWSVLLLGTTLLSASLYVSQSHFDWLWSILTNRYQGWAYASTHLAITLYFACKILPELRFRGRGDSPQPATPP